MSGCRDCPENPEVAHPRWSQTTERVLGTNERIRTRLYNGYEAQVAHLYNGMGGPDAVLLRTATGITLGTNKLSRF